MKSFKILNVRIDQISRDEIGQTIAENLEENKFHHICTVNPEFLVESQKNEKFRNILNKSNLNICDGIGISLLSRLLYKKKVERITGVDVAEFLCKEMAKKKKSLFFLGGFGTAKKAARIMKNKYPDLIIAGAIDGAIETFDEVKKTNPDAILVAFGSPKQEYWLEKYGHQIPSLRIGIGIGGTFDFWSQKTKRAPAIFRKTGFEWLYRLIKEPLKRGKRIFKAILVFPALAIKEYIKPPKF